MPDLAIGIKPNSIPSSPISTSKRSISDLALVQRRLIFSILFVYRARAHMNILCKVFGSCTYLTLSTYMDIGKRKKRAELYTKKINLGAGHISRPKQVEGVLSFSPGQNS
jgi:hypothetical protein